MATEMMGEGDISAWPGEPDWRVNLSLGKLAEECNELSGICVRIMQQGINESEPVTKVANRDALQKEMSDVYATLKFAAIQTGVRHDEERMNRKISGYFRWFNLLMNMERDGTFQFHKRAYEEALTAAKESGYQDMTPAEVIRALMQEIKTHIG